MMRKARIKTALALFSLILFTSCVSTKSFIKFADKNDDLLAMLCASRFPIITEVIEGDVKVIRDTSYIDVPYFIDCDSLINENKRKPLDGFKNTYRGIVSIPIVNEIQTKTNTIVKSNTAQIDVLNKKIINLKADIVDAQRENNSLSAEIKALKKYKILTFVLSGVIAAMCFVKFKN